MLLSFIQELTHALVPRRYECTEGVGRKAAWVMSTLQSVSGIESRLFNPWPIIVLNYLKLHFFL
jgi:hypothetical protein